MKRKSEHRCKKCESNFLRQEPACVVCRMCGWVKYFDDLNMEQIVRQLILNRWAYKSLLGELIDCGEQEDEA